MPLFVVYLISEDVNLKDFYVLINYRKKGIVSISSRILSAMSTGKELKLLTSKASCPGLNSLLFLCLQVIVSASGHSQYKLDKDS